MPGSRPRHAAASIPPSTMGTSTDFPVRLSVMVIVSANVSSVVEASVSMLPRPPRVGLLTRRPGLPWRPFPLLLSHDRGELTLRVLVRRAVDRHHDPDQPPVAPERRGVAIAHGRPLLPPARQAAAGDRVANRRHPRDVPQIG